MAQADDFHVKNDSGAAVRAQINQIIQALVSTNCGPNPPAVTAPGMLWLDTSAATPALKVRDAADRVFEDPLEGGNF